MKSSFNTAVKVLNRFYSLQTRLEKAGRAWNEADAFNTNAIRVHFALSINGLMSHYILGQDFCDFLKMLHERREAFAPHGYGISHAKKTWGKDIICYVAAILNDAYRSCYTSTHDLDDLDLHDDDLERICDHFLDEIKSEYSRYHTFTNWTNFIKEMNLR